MSAMSEITIYTTPFCGDCRRAKQFLSDRGVSFTEVNILEDEKAAARVIQANNGKRKVPTIEVDGRFIACSPFDPYQLSEELKIPLNP